MVAMRDSCKRRIRTDSWTDEAEPSARRRVHDVQLRAFMKVRCDHERVYRQLVHMTFKYCSDKARRPCFG